MPALDSKKTYTTGEIAAFCSVTINAVKKWISTGKLDAYRTPGGHYRVRRDEFRSFVGRYRLDIKDELFPEKKKILIVDDEPATLEYLKGAIESMAGPYIIETARDGYEALIKVGHFKPDLLIMDIRMPRIDGFEVCRRLRLDAVTRDTMILAVTAYGKEDRDRIIECGANFCLAKPVGLKELQNKVERLLR